MTFQFTQFQAAWARYWSGLGTVRHLGDSPAYPLARKVRMPQGHAYDTGALSFRLKGLELHGADRLGDVRSEAPTEAEDLLRLSLRVGEIRLSGAYAVEAKYDPVVRLDTGGTLMDLPPEHLQRTEAGGDSDEPPVDPQQEEWLDQARDQRSKLLETENGQKLMGLYNVHNETYEEVFRENTALTPLWQADGATKEMAADTSAAVKNDAVVNPADKTYSGGVTYNMNAFVQQLNVASACVWQDPDFDPEKGPNPDSKYWAAAKAALSFGKGVSDTTDNTKNQVTEIKASDVHGTVQKHDQDLPPVSDEELMDVISQGSGPGGGEAAGQRGWIVLDEEDRRRLRSLFEKTMHHKAEKAAFIGQPLFTGTVEAFIGDAEAYMELRIERDTEGTSLRVESINVELPAYELDMDDADWSGEAAEVARHRLEGMRFIRSLLHESIVDRLKRDLEDAVRFALPLALKPA